MENKSQIEEKAIAWYIENRNIYKKLSLKIENIIKEILDINEASYHMVTSRTKDIDSFKKKIAKEKYDDPINQITDLAGIRIITYVEDEMTYVCKIIEKIFYIDKDNSLDKSIELGIDKVGYKSVHYIAKLENDRLLLPEYRIFKNRYFEIQVRTILQHAWAEIEHDRNYKFSGKLPGEISRRFKLLAGSLELSDIEFNNISREFDKVTKQIIAGTKRGNLNFELSSTSLKQYIETKFSPLINAGFNFNLKDDGVILRELEDYEIRTLNDLDKIIPKDLIEVLLDVEANIKDHISLGGLFRLILISHDSEKYFTKSWKNTWHIWSPIANPTYKKLFDHYKINWNILNEKYGVKLHG